MRGNIFDIKRYAIHDGPGIRTTVFLKGCRLHCRWCHNPESQAVGTVSMKQVRKLGDREFEEIRKVGYGISVDELVEEIAKDAVFFEESGGGVTFSGGEPLLHPDLTDCLNIIRNIFPKTRIILVTNGINLHKMSDAFYKVCQYNDIEILVTDYGLIDINNILHQIKSKGVKIDIYQTCRDWYFQNIRLTEEINDCFNQCYHRKQCINYKEEKIFLCPQMAYIDIFNKSFSANIVVKENEYVDLNKISNYDELIRLLSSLHPDFCSIYCNCTSPNGNPEKIGKRYTTKKDIKEFCKL